MTYTVKFHGTCTTKYAILEITDEASITEVKCELVKIFKHFYKFDIDSIEAFPNRFVIRSGFTTCFADLRRVDYFSIIPYEIL